MAFLVSFQITAGEYGEGIIAEQGFQIRGGHHVKRSFG
jgi:hypothetical protein